MRSVIWLMKPVVILAIVLMALSVKLVAKQVSLVCPALNKIHLQANTVNDGYQYDYFALEKKNEAGIIYAFNFTGEGNGVKFTKFEGADLDYSNADATLLCNYDTSDDNGEVLWNEDLDDQHLAHCHFQHSSEDCDSSQVDSCPLTCDQI